MAGDAARVRALLDETQDALSEASAAFDEEFPTSPTPPTPGPVIRVKVGENVQAAFDQARLEGATLLLEVGEHRCNLVVAADPSNTFKPVLMTSDTSDLPGPGVRIGLEYATGIACLRSANNIDPVIRYNCGSTGLNLRGLGILPQQYDRTMIVFGTDAMTDPDEQPFSIVHDQLLMLGDPELGQHRGIQAHCRGYALLNSSLLDMFEEGRDSQCLAAWNGGQYLWLRNNCFEAGAENIMIGGGDARVEALAPAHWLIEDCLFTKDYAWTALEHRPVIKCLFEIKHLRHGTIRHNTFEHCWKADWDKGLAIAIKCTDQSHDEPWTLTEDIRFEQNTIRRVGTFLSIVGKNDDGYETQLMRDVTIAGNVCTEMNTGDYQGRGTAIMFSNMPDRLTVDHNTIVGNFYALSELAFNQPVRGEAFTLTNTVVWQGAYGIKGPSGMDCWDWEADLGYAPTVQGNALRRHPDRQPEFGPGNVHLSEADFDGSLNADGSVKPGSPVALVTTTDGEGIGA